ncbi:MAG: FMN-binding protein [Bacillota bacterium]
MGMVLSVIGVILLIAVVGFLFVIWGLGSVRKMVINEVDLTAVPDGIYKGFFHKNRWNCEVEVTVREHRISAIVPRGKFSSDFQRELYEKATEAILSKQSLDIDVVSGASANTKAFQKAVENALTEGVRL